VLAFELTGSDPHKVLLFVGDARGGQFGSPGLLSRGGDEKGKEILNRTVFYKVGHHAAATPR